MESLGVTTTNFGEDNTVEASTVCVYMRKKNDARCKYMLLILATLASVAANSVWNDTLLYVPEKDITTNHTENPTRERQGLKPPEVHREGDQYSHDAPLDWSGKENVHYDTTFDMEYNDYVTVMGLYNELDILDDMRKYEREYMKEYVNTLVSDLMMESYNQLYDELDILDDRRKYEREYVKEYANTLVADLWYKQANLSQKILKLEARQHYFLAALNGMMIVLFFVAAGCGIWCSVTRGEPPLPPAMVPRGTVQHRTEDP